VVAQRNRATPRQLLRFGPYRALENGLPIDATGDLRGTDIDGPFNGPIELAHRLAGSEQARQCMMNQWFRYAMARGESERDGCALTKVYQSFAASGYNVRELVMTLVTSDTFRLRRAH